MEATLAHWHKTEERESMAKMTRQHSSEGTVASSACAMQTAAEQSFAKIKWRNSCSAVASSACARQTAAEESFAKIKWRITSKRRTKMEQG